MIRVHFGSMNRVGREKKNFSLKEKDIERNREKKKTFGREWKWFCWAVTSFFNQVKVHRLRTEDKIKANDDFGMKKKDEDFGMKKKDEERMKTGSGFSIEKESEKSSQVKGITFFRYFYTRKRWKERRRRENRKNERDRKNESRRKERKILRRDSLSKKGVILVSDLCQNISNANKNESWPGLENLILVILPSWLRKMQEKRRNGKRKSEKRRERKNRKEGREWKENRSGI